MHSIRPFFSHSIFISICAAALAGQTFVLLKQTIQTDVLLFVGCATLGAYNLYWLIFSQTTHAQPGSFHISWKKLRVHFLLILLPAPWLLYCMFQHTDWVLPFIIGSLLSLSYIALMFANHSVRVNILAGFLKTILLAAAWTYVTISLPMVAMKIKISSSELSLLCSRFLFLLMLAVIFDARDIQKDHTKGTRTMATLLKGNALQALMILLCLAFIVSVWALSTWIMPVKLSMITSGVFVFVLYQMAQKPRGKYFYYFLVDGMMLIFAVSVYIASI